MKKIILLFMLSSTYIFSNINAVVSILPEKTFIKAVGGDKVDIALMVMPGNSPHTYEPKPSQMKEIAKADLYFAIGVEFEKVWLPRFKDLNGKMQIIDLTQGITKLPMQAHEHHGEHTGHKHEEMGYSSLDPHVWTSPSNVRIIAKNIYNALAKADPENKEYYRQNLDSFISKINETDRKIKAILAKTPKGTKFMVFHPSWGYFAHEYNLVQLPVEVEGKSPKPRELIALIKEAKVEKIKAIFTQPEFSDAAAQTMAKELKISVIKVSPLSEKWSENLLNIARAIAGNK
ncbi:metal ABC transporter solute-binding protein, Zn/Mn family [Sulfurovum sp. NBC37-1]|uniref:metal ABC transporter solute-binding protein, Zn/Mn family n=1 Tax=Sulfurovum sp. (strain NBC37-1) TaxID=387093 RepID=UPI00015878CB|nr:zinc ABC transporter substrate-binding protein [Sulfurovum sp. NBC37-1]BAF72020.1 Mn2+/Zn2+ ABC transporter, substrate-binding protein [Sulfurovum sp. NBC37-1]